MQRSAYDEIEDFYLNFVRDGLETPHTLFTHVSQFLLDMVGDVREQRVLDLCCGEGHFSRELASRGTQVTGVDSSTVNLTAARARSASGPKIRFLLDDAQTLLQISNQEFDLVVCKMAFMDVPDMDALLAAVHRVLKRHGRFLVALLHPCFETPFEVPFQPVETDEGGGFMHHRVQRYFDEGLWYSGGIGVRGHVGAHHRKISTYLNRLLANGFRLVRIEEPQLPVGESDSVERQWSENIPRTLFLEVVKEVVG